MSFCKKCGQEISSNEQFCGNCGMGVVEGRNLNIAPKETRSSSNSNINVYINEILEVAKGMLRKPISTIVNCDIKLKKESTGILILGLAVLFGILNMWTVKKLASDMEKLFSDSIGGVFGLNGMLGESITGRMSYSKILFQSVLLFVIAIIILFALNYLIGKYIFKASVKPLTIVNIVSCSAIPFVVALFLRIILSYISSTLAFTVLFLGVIIAMISLFRGITEALNLSEEITVFIIPISYLGMFCVEYIMFGKMITSIFM